MDVWPPQDTHSCIRAEHFQVPTISGKHQAYQHSTRRIRVVSLITCIPLELARETIVNILDIFCLNLPSTATIEMFEHYQSKYFQFSKCNYQQVKRAPMASPISGLIDETVLQRLGRLVFAVIAPKFRKRYANDTFVVIKIMIMIYNGKK